MDTIEYSYMAHCDSGYLDSWASLFWSGYLVR